MKLVTTALEWTYGAGETDVRAERLKSAEELLVLRHGTLKIIDGAGPNASVPQSEGAEPTSANGTERKTFKEANSRTRRKRWKQGMQDVPHSSRGLDPTPVKTVLIVEDDVDIAEVRLTLLRVTTARLADPCVRWVCSPQNGTNSAPASRPARLWASWYGWAAVPGAAPDEQRNVTDPGPSHECCPAPNIQARNDLIPLEKPFEMGSLLPLHNCYLDGGLVPLFLLSTQIVTSL